MMYTYNNELPISWSDIPHRIILSNGMTRTDKSTFTKEELADAGFIEVEDPPQTTGDEIISWSGTEWQVSAMTEQQKQERINVMWNDIRASRNARIEEITWRIQRYDSEMRLGLHPTDDINKLDTYIQALRDITKQQDPTNIIWPVLEIESQQDAANINN